MRASSWSRYSLFLLSALVLVLAVSLYKLRRQRRQIAHIQATNLVQQQNSQRAVALLFQALWADNHQTYTARTTSMAVYGNEKINTVAKMTHVPEGYAITYLSGDPRGLSSGFSQRWAWRQDNPSGPATAYAAAPRNATELTAERFGMMLKNYGAMWDGQEKIGGRAADVVWISPFSPVAGARGPAKRLWIDTKTHLTLRVETFNYQMHPVMDSTLSDIDLTPSHSDIKFPFSGDIEKTAKSNRWMAQDMGNDIKAVTAQTGGLAPPDAKELPVGFVRESVGVHRYDSTPGAPPAALSRYTDGFNTLTIFALKSSATGAKETMQPVSDETGKSNSSTNSTSANSVQTCAFGPGTLVMRDIGSVHLVAVADLPPETLCRVLGVGPGEAISQACPPSPPTTH